MMLKKLGILTILVVLALMVSVPAVSARGGPPPGRGQPLATGSIWIQPYFMWDPDEGEWIPVDFQAQIHVNFNARAGDLIFEADPDDPDGFPYDIYKATGHIFWREGGQTIRLSVDQMFFMSGEGWTCANMSGIVYAGHETRENLCFMVCDDYDVFTRWNYVPYFLGLIDPQRGNLTIKP